MATPCVIMTVSLNICTVNPGNHYTMVEKAHTLEHEGWWDTQTAERVREERANRSLDDEKKAQDIRYKRDEQVFHAAFDAKLKLEGALDRGGVAQKRIKTARGLSGAGQDKLHLEQLREYASDNNGKRGVEDKCVLRPKATADTRAHGRGRAGGRGTFRNLSRGNGPDRVTRSRVPADMIILCAKCFDSFGFLAHGPNSVHGAVAMARCTSKNWALFSKKAQRGLELARSWAVMLPHNPGPASPYCCRRALSCSQQPRHHV